MTYHDILAEVHQQVEHSGIGQFCFICGEPGVSVKITPEGEVFVCDHAGHHSPRAFIFDGKAVYSFENGELIHEAAGALVRQGTGENRQTLLFLRRKFPFLYTIPAGHIEQGHEPEGEMRREVAEESGMIVQSATALWANETLIFEDPCRRGANLHRWHVFDVVAEGMPRLSDEGKIIGWYSDHEIRALAADHLLTAPMHKIFSRLGICEP